MTTTGSKYIDRQSFLLRTTCEQTCQKTINCIQFWLLRQVKLTLGGKETGELVHYHEDSINLGFGLMKNNKAHFTSGQSGLLGFARLGTVAKK